MVLLLALLLQTEDVRALIEKLRSDKPAEREAAAYGLRDLGRAAVPQLEEAARSPDVKLAQQAKYLLKAIPVRQKLSSIIFDLMPGVEERLAEGGVEAWTAVLMETLRKDKDGDLIYTSLRKTDLEALAAPVVAGEKDPSLRLKALQLVVDWKLKGVLPTVAKVLEDPDPAMRIAAASVLGRLQAREFVHPVAALLKDADPKVVAQAIESLKELRPRDVRADDLVPLLADPRLEVRKLALVALRELRNYNSAFPMAALLKDADADLRATTALALGEFGARWHVAVIAPLLLDKSPEVRQAALWSLGALDARDRVADVVLLFADPDPRVRARAAETLARLNVKEKKLLALLEDVDDDVRIRTAWSLGELGFGETELRKALTSGRPLAAAGAALALGRLGAVAAVPEIVALTRPGPDAASRALAVLALGELGGADELRKLLGDPEAKVRAAAAQALGRLNEDADYGKLLNDPDSTVRLWAGLALARRGLRDGLAVILEEAPKQGSVCLLWFNRLREPDLWNRLENKELDEALEGTAMEILQALAAKAKLQPFWGVDPGRKRYRIPAGTSLLCAMERVRFWSGSDAWEIVFAPRGFVVRSREEALAFYRR